MVPVWVGREPRTCQFHCNVSGTTSLSAGGKLYHQTSPHPRRWSKSAHTRSSDHLPGTDSQPVCSSELCSIVPVFSGSHWVLLRHSLFIWHILHKSEYMFVMNKRLWLNMHIYRDKRTQNKRKWHNKKVCVCSAFVSMMKWSMTWVGSSVLMYTKINKQFLLET